MSDHDLIKQAYIECYHQIFWHLMAWGDVLIDENGKMINVWQQAENEFLEEENGQRAESANTKTDSRLETKPEDGMD